MGQQGDASETGKSASLSVIAEDRQDRSQK